MPRFAIRGGSSPGSGSGETIPTATIITAGPFNANSFDRVRYDPSGGTFTINMPATPQRDTQVGVKNVTSDVTAITVSGNGNDVEDPSASSFDASVTVAGDGASIVWEFDGTSWVIVQESYGVPTSVGSGANSERFGVGSLADGDFSSAFGNDASAPGTEATAVGHGTRATGANSLAAGVDAAASQSGNIAIGHAANASGTDRAISIGDGTVASGASAIVVGRDSSGTGSNAIVMGRTSDAIGSAGNIIVGTASDAEATGSHAWGSNVSSTGTNSIGLGTLADIASSFGLGLGFNTTIAAGHDNAIAIGHDAITTGANDGQWGSTAFPVDFFMYGDASIPGKDSVNGQQFLIKSATTELIGLSGASVAASSLIPAGAVVLGVTARVTTAITGATAFDIGDGVDPNRWGSAIAIALDTTSDNTDWTAQDITNFAAANDIVLTAITSDFTAGAVRLTVHYMSPTAPTS